MRVFQILLFSISFSFSIYAQSVNDYKLINLLIQEDTPNVEEQPADFLAYMHYSKNTFNRKKQKSSQRLSNYQHVINLLFGDTLMQYQNKISKTAIRKAFVKWNAKSILYDHVVYAASKRYFYYTRPIFLSETLFAVLSFHKMAGGGISACLYKWNKEENAIVCLNCSTYMLIEINFR